MEDQRAAQVSRLRQVIAELEQADPGVGDEIAAARLVLVELLAAMEADELDPVKVSEGLLNVGQTIYRLRQMERLQSNASVESIADAATRILEELGYGGE